MATGGEGAKGRTSPVGKLAGRLRASSWALLAAGVVFAVAGVACLVWPGRTLDGVALTLGIVFVLGGIAGAAEFFLRGARGTFSGWLPASAAVGLVLGVVFLTHPAWTAAALSWLIGAAIVVAGVVQLAGAWRMHKKGGLHWVFELVTGLASLVLGIVMIATPATLPWALSVFAVVYGVALAALAFRVVK